MLKVLKELCRLRTNIVLLVVGNGEELKEMKTFTRKLNLEENIVFTGMQEDVRPYYKLSDICIICSLTEGLALTAYEALSMSVPVITSDVRTDRPNL